MDTCISAVYTSYHGDKSNGVGKETSNDAIIGEEMEKDAIEKPIIDHLNNSVVFRPIGVMYPTMTFGHLRSTIDLKKLRQLVGKICNISETIKGF